ncbi:LysR family transcriptional regulator [Providencia manganoxydans]
MMDSRLLRAFVILAETANYHAAASLLHITQPALTKQIKLLEQQLSVVLFERGRHGAHLTNSGRTLLPLAQQVLSRTEKLLHKAIELNTQLPTSLSVGFGISAFHEASFFVAHLREHLPQTTISLDDMPSETMIQKLENRQLQIAFLRRPDKKLSSQFSIYPLKQETLALAISHSQWVDKPIEQLLTIHPYLALRKARGAGLSQQISQFLAHQQLSLKPAQESSDIQTIIALVAAGAGISLLPYSARHISHHDIHFIPLEDKPFSTWPIDVAWLSSHSAHLQHIITTLLEETVHHFNQGSPV